MKLYVVRHGQTLWNLSGRVNGITDTVLTENGITQAELRADERNRQQSDLKCRRLPFFVINSINPRTLCDFLVW